MRGAIAFLASAFIGGCYLAHERPSDAAAEMDGGRRQLDAISSVDTSVTDARASDGSSSDSDAPPCERFGGMTFAGPCTPELTLECQRRADIEASGRPAYVTCIEFGSQATCSPGTICPLAGRPCQCTPTRTCAYAIEVCVSDSPDGPRYCSPVCTP